MIVDLAPFFHASLILARLEKKVINIYLTNTYVSMIMYF
jgi:hypothetical protein